MAKLYPPYIEGSIPAFYGKELIVPYEMNKTVGYKDISGFKLKIITVSTNRTITIIDDNGYNIESKEIYFNMPIENMVIGQFYKIQLAYKDISGNVGFYSTIGVVKYCAEPAVSIEGLLAGNINLHQYDYVGYYKPADGDPTEAEIYYQFDVYDCNNKLYASSGKKIHNATIEGGDLYTLMDTFEEQQIYTIQYKVWTLNGLKISTRKYRIIERESLNIEIDAELSLSENFDEGYIDITLVDKADHEQVVEGTFVISRADSLTNFKVWNEFYRFELRNEKLKSFSCRDFTTQQGVEYIYSIQQYNDNGLYSNRLLSKKIKMDFEDAFLFDGERQLRLRYNPKVNSFKNSVLEQKVNTIGNKYPFIFRNGNVSYKEFPIGGLISYLEDEENLFSKEYDIKKYNRKVTPHAEEDIIEYLPTDLINDNQTKERIFKLAVLDWLTDGKPKLFRSPSEGNYIVRLLNTSLSPENALGRMIHNFTATAYEIAECNYNNLIFYNFINPNNIDKIQIKWETIELDKMIKNPAALKKVGKINRYPAITVEFKDMRPGDKIILDGQEIQIGVNGSYYISLGRPIKEIIIPENTNYIGSMTYSFYGESVSKFNDIFDVQLYEIPARQFKGPCDILAEIKNSKFQITDFYLLNFRKENNITVQEEGTPNHNYWAFNDDNIFEENEYLILLNGNPISIKEIETYSIKDLNNIKSLIIGPDIICDASYQIKNITYNIENTNQKLLENKALLKDYENKFINILNSYNENMKKYEDELFDINFELLTNEKVAFLSNKEKKELEQEIENIKNNIPPYYKEITFEEAQNYTNRNLDEEEQDENFLVVRDPWKNVLNKLQLDIELLEEENTEESLKEVEYLKILREDLNTIIANNPPEDFKYQKINNENKIYLDTGTSLRRNENGDYSYLTIDKIRKSDLTNFNENEINEIIAQPGFEMNLKETNATELVIKTSEEQAYIQPERPDESNNILHGSLWIQTQNNNFEEPFYSQGNDINIYAGTYIGYTDPFDLDLDMKIWIDISDLNDNQFENSLQKALDVFYYNGENYKDIAYLDKEVLAYNPQDIAQGWRSAAVMQNIKYTTSKKQIVGKNNNTYTIPEYEITSIDFKKPVRYTFFFERSHYEKGYCLYQFYNYETAKKRIDYLNHSINDYCNKFDLEIIEVEDWLIKNDINERKELEEYILKCEENIDPVNYSKENPKDIYRPISLNEIKNKKLYIADEVETMYKKIFNGDRLALSFNIPKSYYYKTGNYSRLKWCRDRIRELTKILNSMTEKDKLLNRKSELENDILNLENSLEISRKELEGAYELYIGSVENVLKEEKSNNE